MTYLLLHLLSSLTSASALATFEAQGPIAPGTFGFWKVWGARPHDARPGDLVLSKVEDEVAPTLVLARFESKAGILRAGIVSPEGEVTIGALCPVIILRPGTSHTLA